MEIVPTKRSRRINLLEACVAGNLHQVTEICTSKRRLKTELTLCDNHNWTPLHHVVANGSVECLKVLLDIPNLNTKCKTYEGLTALHVACRDEATPLEIVSLLLKRDPELVHLVNNEEVSPLHDAIWLGRLDIVTELVQCGASVNYCDLDGEHSLFYAVRGSHLDCISYLLEHSECDPFLMNVNGHTTLELAIITRIFNPLRGHAVECTNELIRIMCTRRIGSDEPKLLYVLVQSIKLAFSILDRDVLQKIIDRFHLRDENPMADVIRKLLTFPNIESIELYRLAMVMHDFFVSYYVSLLFGDNFEFVKQIFEVLFQIYDKDLDFFLIIHKEIKNRLPRLSSFKKELYESGFYQFFYDNMVTTSLTTVQNFFQFTKSVTKLVSIDFNRILLKHSDKRGVSLRNIDRFCNDKALIIFLPLCTLVDVQDSGGDDGTGAIPSLLDLARCSVRKKLFTDSTQCCTVSRILSLDIPPHTKNLLCFNYYKFPL